MNVSAWCIRNPIPSVLLFLMLSLGGLLGFQSMKVQQFPDIDLPTVTVSASLPGAAPAPGAGDRGGAQDRELDRLGAGPQARLPSCRMAAPPSRPSSAWRSRPRRRWTMYATPSARVRSDLPADMRDPVIAKMELSGQPILTYTVASARMDDEALSWFHGQTRSTERRPGCAWRGQGGPRGRGHARGARRAGSRCASCRRSGAAAADILAPGLRDPAGRLGRAHRRGRAGAVGAHHAPVRAADELARMDIALSDGRRIRLDQVRTQVSDTVAEQRSAALCQRQAGGGLRDRAQPGRGRDRRGRGRARRTRAAQGRTPGHHGHRGLQFRRARCRRISTAR